MARIRSVHPSLFTDEAWVSCSPLARILYIGLWTDADDQGLFEWKPLQIKMRLLPGDGVNTGELLDELTAVDLVKPYEVDGKRFGAIRDFRKFQRPQKPNAVHPITENIAEYVCLSATDEKPVADQSRTTTRKPKQMEDVGEGVEEKEESPLPPKGEKKARRRSVPIPDGFPDMEALQIARDIVAEAGVAVHVRTEAQKIRDWALAKGELKADWLAAWRGWIRRACEGKPKLGLVVSQDQSEQHDPWPGRVRAWVRDEGWNDVDWGPEPFEPGCRVPAHHLPRRAEG